MNYEEAQIVLLDQDLNDPRRQALRELFHELTGQSFNEFVLALVDSAKAGARSAALLDLKLLTGDHLAVCNEFFSQLEERF